MKSIIHFILLTLVSSGIALNLAYANPKCPSVAAMKSVTYYATAEDNDGYCSMGALNLLANGKHFWLVGVCGIQADSDNDALQKANDLQKQITGPLREKAKRLHDQEGEFWDCKYHIGNESKAYGIATSPIKQS